ncbi:glycosyltransferase family 4 protein [Rhodovibrionaceae bacterium A322]
MGKRLLFVVNDAGFFLSHRLPLAKAAAAEGWTVAVATPADPAQEQIKVEGFESYAFPMGRFSLNPLNELKTIMQLRGIMRRFKPDLVHSVTLRAVLPAAIAARLAWVPAQVFAVTGGGTLFTKQGTVGEILRWTLRTVLKTLANRRTRLIVQNPENREVLAPSGSWRDHCVLIRGSGVNLEDYQVRPEGKLPAAVLLAARLINKKGIPDFVEAARLLKAKGTRVRFLLAGDPDPGNPDSVTQQELENWQKEGLLAWLGKRRDMAKVMAESHIVCLPSAYGEGVPKVLLEAAACGRPMVATDIAGCREVVIEGETGHLVPPRDAPALAEAIGSLVADKAKRQAYGAAARRLAEEEYGVERVNQATLAVYRDISG